MSGGANGLLKRVGSQEVQEKFGVRFVQISHVHIEISTGNKVLFGNHHFFNAVTHIMDRLGR